MATETSTFERIGDLARVPDGGIDDSVIRAWQDQFRRALGTDEDADFELTTLQREVAGDADAFRPNGRNLVITGPTSAGKTLCAEMLMANHLKRASHPLGCIYAVPLRALATEKWERFKAIFGPGGVYVSSSDYQQYDPFILRRFRIAVLVYEKLYSWLLSPQDGPKILSRTGLMVVDELHMLTDPQRGAKLELLLTFVRD